MAGVDTHPCPFHARFFPPTDPAVLRAAIKSTGQTRARHGARPSPRRLPIPHAGTYAPSHSRHPALHICNLTLTLPCDTFIIGGARGAAGGRAGPGPVRLRARQARRRPGTHARLGVCVLGRKDGRRGAAFPPAALLSLPPPDRPSISHVFFTTGASGRLVGCGLQRLRRAGPLLAFSSRV